MGNLWSQLSDSMTTWFADAPARIILIGLDAAGKTTLVYKLKLNETVTTIPTDKTKSKIENCEAVQKKFKYQTAQAGQPNQLFLFRFPMIGFNVETVTPVKGLTMTVWDLGGQEKIRSLWRYYVTNVDAVIWMVDSNDSERFGESRENLMRMLAMEELNGVPVLLQKSEKKISFRNETKSVSFFEVFFIFLNSRTNKTCRMPSQ